MRPNLATLVDELRRHGQQIAVVRHVGVRRHVTTYAELARLSGRFAALLAAHKIVAGERVLLWAENSAEWIAAFYGCMLRGVLVVPLDAYGSTEFAARVARDVNPRMVVGDELLLTRLHAVLPKLPCLSFEEWKSVLPAVEVAPIDSLNASTPLQILFTSGTTDDPKGVVLTHGNVISSVDPIERGAHPYLRFERFVHPLRFLHTLPLSHVFGQTMGLWVPPIFAAEVHFESRLVASRLIETIKRERISVLAAVPRVHALLQVHIESIFPNLREELQAAQHMRAWHKWMRFRAVHRLFGLKFWALISGGGALAPEVESFWNALGFVLVQGYGMTETSALITLNHPFHVARGSIGKPLPGREVKIGGDGEVLVRGPMISTATWSQGRMEKHASEWLATGDLAEQKSTGELRFVGRKSEVIVTSAGVNLHPEDIERVLDRQPGVAASAVVGVDLSGNVEPYAVLAMRGSTRLAATAIAQANAELAEFQRVRSWALWPDPDLPRTSTGKVKRPAVREWLRDVQRAAADPKAAHAAAQNQDWLLALIARVTGQQAPGIGDELRLSEDLKLDSLGRVQLSAALEERLNTHIEENVLESLHTLGELRALVYAVHAHADARIETHTDARDPHAETPHPYPSFAFADAASSEAQNAIPYPRWPWSGVCCWLRALWMEIKMCPLIWLLAHPRVKGNVAISADEPMLIVCNHATAFDGPLVLYALPRKLRQRVTIAMAGEMLEAYRHFRNPEDKRSEEHFYFFGPAIRWLLLFLFNVFPLPRKRGFEQSFQHAGRAMDRGFHVLLFPEGTRSKDGTLGRFRSGIGLLTRQTGARVLPVALCGLGAMKTGKSRWFRSGKLEVRVGEPMRFPATMSESAIAERLRAEVARLMNA